MERNQDIVARLKEDCLFLIGLVGKVGKRRLEIGKGEGGRASGKHDEDKVYARQIEERVVLDGQLSLVIQDFVGRVNQLYVVEKQTAVPLLVKFMLCLMPAEGISLLSGSQLGIAVEEWAAMALQTGLRSCNALVGCIDMVASTRVIFNEPRLGPEKKAIFMHELVEEIQREVEQYGARVVVFTGDGVIFYVEDSGQRSAWGLGHKLSNLALHLNQFFEESDKLRELGSISNIAVPDMRVGLSYGEVILGRVGPTENIIGIPVIEAARICSKKELYNDRVHVVVTSMACGQSGKFCLGKPMEFIPAGKVDLGGIGEIDVLEFRTK